MTTFSLSFLLLAPCLVQDPPAEPSIAEQQTLRMYEVSDLTGKDELPDQPFWEVGEERAVDAQVVLDLQERKEAAARVHDQAEHLRQLVVSYMRPKLTDPKGNLHLFNDGVLALTGSDEQHAWTRQFLDVQRRTTGMVEIQVRLVTVPEGRMRTLGVEGSSALYENDVKLDALMHGLTGEDIEWITAPRVLTHLRQRAQISVLNQVAYLEDYELVVVEPGSVEIIDPVVGVVQEGTFLEILNAPVEPGVFGIDLNLDLSTLERPIPTKTIQVGADRREFEIGQPKVTTVNVSSKMLLRDGATALLISPDPTRDVDLGVFITLRHVLEVPVDPDEHEK